MSRHLILSTAVAGLALVAGLAFTAGPPDDAPAALRVGVYDNRAIAVAYAGSELSPIGAKMKEYEQAKAAGDQKRIKELESWGPKHQRQLHRQGFGRVPVTDLLELVQDRLPEAARKAGVDVIAFECNYCGPGVEEVDVTMELVMLFDPSAKTLKTVKELRKIKPLDLDVIEQNHDH